MKKFIIALVTVSSFLGLEAQNSIDALRYSRNDYSGTARFSAMGGSFGALGGEVSALSINPAGIGLYRNSEFTFSTGFNNHQSSINFRGENKEDGRINFNIPNIAYVGSYKGDPNGWKNYSFGITFNRVNTFSADKRAFGVSDNSTIIDDYANFLDNTGFAPVSDVENYAYPFGHSQAWQLLLLDTLTDVNTGLVRYIPYVFREELVTGIKTVESIQQEVQIDNRGSQSETQFSFGGNFQDKLYLGASVGFQRVRFQQDRLFRETYTYNDQSTVSDTFKIATYEETSTIETTGNGVNFKLGVIYKINDQLRAGAAIHSPTFFGLNETFLFDSRSVFADGFEVRGDSTTNNFGYRITTPTRYNVSLAYLIQQHASVNVDYEFVNYSSASFNDKEEFNSDFSSQNEEIDNLLTSAHHVRVGAEYKFNPFVARLGYNYQGNPYDSDLVDSDESRHTYSIGGGFRNKNFNFDVAFNFREANSRERFYSSSDADAGVEEIENNLIFTFGWKW